MRVIYKIEDDWLVVTSPRFIFEAYDALDLNMLVGMVFLGDLGKLRVEFLEVLQQMLLIVGAVMNSSTKFSLLFLGTIFK